ncbi:hypothetical protein [Pseudonocardia sp. GCM10023141]|uniref:hypothetical protein n=1 Tax=Pseudonocardia sp. GCM10023141 TaxID=3252653 RepID=UPI00361393E1
MNGVTNGGAHRLSGRPLWSLAEDARVDDDPLTVRGRWGAVPIADPRPPVREALRRMSLGPVALENIALLRHGYARRRFEATLQRLGGYVVPSLGGADGIGPVLSVIAVVPDAVFVPPPIARAAVVALRRGCLFDRRADECVLTCPGRAYQVVLHRPAAVAVVGALGSGPRPIGEIAAAADVDPRDAADVAAYLCGAGVAVLGEANLEVLSP